MGKLNQIFDKILGSRIMRAFAKDRNDPIVVHVGKCGGSSVQEALIRENYRYIEYHVLVPKFDPRKKYIIVIRNPMARFVSAFNWRYKLVVEDGIQPHRFKGEKALLEKFQTPNNLAEQIKNAEGEVVIDFQKDEFYIHHLKEDIFFHLGEFLEECKKENIIAVLATETLEEDMKRHFNMELGYHLKKNKRPGKEFLSELAKENLRIAFARDYWCIEKLNEMGLLTRQQYEELSK